MSETNELNSNDSVKETSSHAFDFGFRYPIINGLARINTPDKGNQWFVEFAPPEVGSTIWYGNCVQDAIVSVESLRKLGLTKARIIRIHVDGLGNSPRGFEHYRATVGRQVSIDHSKFFQAFINESSSGYKANDLTDNEEESLRKSHTGVQGRLVEKTYTEFLLGADLGLAEVSLWNGTNDDFRIGFDLTMPQTEHPDFRVYLPLPYGKVDRAQIDRRISRADFSFAVGHPGEEGFSAEKQTGAKKLFPQGLIPPLQSWYREILNVLPKNLPNPNKSRFRARFGF